MDGLKVGIDPGSKTGYAVWCCSTARLIDVQTCGIIEAMQLVRHLHEFGRLHSVTFEDARLRKWFGTKGVETLQGAGAIKRESGIWQEFMESLPGAAFKQVSPRAKGAKLDAEQFKKLTGWRERTSEHGRDAAMLVIELGALR